MPSRLTCLLRKVADLPVDPQAAASQPEDPRKQQDPNRVNWRNKLLAGAGLGTTAAGAGLMAAGYKMVDPADESRLKAFLEKAKAWTPDRNPTDVYNEYTQYGGDAIRSKVFGHDPMGLMRFTRQIAGKFSPDLKWDDADSAGHYIAFQNGPMSSWNRWVHEWQGTNNQRIQDTLAQEKAKGYWTSKLPTGITDYLKAPFQRFEGLKADVAQQYNPGIVSEFLKSKGLDSDPDKIPLAMQQKVWPEFRTWVSTHHPVMGSLINHEVNKSVDRITGNAANHFEGGGKNYSNMIRGFLGLRDVGRATGFAVAGGGLGLLGLAALRHHQDIKRRNAEAQQQVAQQQAQQATQQATPQVEQQVSQQEPPDGRDLIAAS